jgi:uncharacterized protein (TIGR02001 family)
MFLGKIEKNAAARPGEICIISNFVGMDSLGCRSGLVPLGGAVCNDLIEGINMRKLSLKLAGAAVAFAAVSMATPAFAQDAEEASDPITVTGSVAVVTDYRFRGISQTDKNFAVQAGVTVAHESGVYAGVWGSSVDDYIAAGADQEIDLIAGYKKSFGDTTLDVGAIYYYYPGSSQILPGYSSDFLELYGSATQAFGPVSAKLAVAYAPKSSALDYGFGKEDNFYANLGLSATIPDTGLGVSAGIGRTFTRSFLSGGIKYTDWSAGLSYTTGPVTLGVSYVDTNATGINPISGKDIYKAGVLGSLTVAF